MTAEVAILNKLGVALAADSTVTIGDKTYDTTNKLFALSKYHPVGILVYNSMELTTLPVEVIIKNYRSHLSRRSKPNLSEYSIDFIRYVKTKLPIGKNEQIDSMKGIVSDRCRSVVTRLRRECNRQSVPTNNSSSSDKVRAILYDLLDEYEQEISDVGRYPGLKKSPRTSYETTIPAQSKMV